MPKRFGLGKDEKLKSRKLIETVFSTGKRASSPPVSATYLFTPGEGLIRIGVTASKRQFKRATDRNRIKRLLREAYRLQKESFIEAAKAAGRDGSVFFIYNQKEVLTFEEICISMDKLLKKLTGRIAGANE